MTKQFGTLGSGNHFFELCVDERGRVWVVLHSGSRGIGNQLAQMHIAKARRLAKDLELRLEDPDLAYFLEGTPEFAGLHRRHAVGPGLRPGQPRPDDGQRDARGVRVHRLRPGDAAHQLPSQLHPARGPQRRRAVDHPQGCDQGRRRRPRCHPRLDGHAQLHRGAARATRRAGRRARTAPAAGTAAPRPRSSSPPPTSPSRWRARSGSTSGPTRWWTRSPRPTRTSTRSWPTRPTWSRSCHTLHQVLNYKGT